MGDRSQAVFQVVNDAFRAEAGKAGRSQQIVGESLTGTGVFGDDRGRASGGVRESPMPGAVARPLRQALLNGGPWAMPEPK